MNLLNVYSAWKMVESLSESIRYCGSQPKRPAEAPLVYPLNAILQPLWQAIIDVPLVEQRDNALAAGSADDLTLWLIDLDECLGLDQLDLFVLNVHNFLILFAFRLGSHELRRDTLSMGIGDFIYLAGMVPIKTISDAWYFRFSDTNVVYYTTIFLILFRFLDLTGSILPSSFTFLSTASMGSSAVV